MVLINKDTYSIDIKDNIDLDDWGYFIDIEEYDNKEEQYNLYIKNEIKQYTKKNITKKNKVNLSLGTNLLIKISSTSLVSILLTYFIISIL
jgi:hypothetical protein